jgi:hypothetical protein
MALRRRAVPCLTPVRSDVSDMFDVAVEAAEASVALRLTRVSVNQNWVERQ